MMKQPYFPHTEASRVIWINHFCIKFNAYGPGLGVGPDEIATTAKHLQYYVWLIQYWYVSVQQFALAATATKESMAMDESGIITALPVPVVFDNPPEPCPPGILARLFKLIQRIKSSPNYTEAIGQDLGIIGSQAADTHAYPEGNPSIKRNTTQEYVEIKFPKYHHTAVLIESRRNGSDWENVGVGQISPWNDERPLQTAGVPEVREYRLCWYENNKISGDFSPVIKITVGP